MSVLTAIKLRHITSIVIYLIINVHAQLGPFCFDGGASSVLNGEFVDTLQQNDGKNYYMMDNSGQTDCTDRYLFWNNCYNQWYIGTAIITGCSINYNRECISITNVDDPSTCTNWHLTGTDFGAVLTERACGGPALCSSITLTGSAGPCSGIFPKITGNQFGPNNGYYLIYMKVYKKWACVDDIASNWGCQSVSWYWGSTEEYKYPFQVNDQQIYDGITFTCNGTPQPTNNPTSQPTTQPITTDQPTVLPTAPTSNPTPQPTSQPTAQPTDQPTALPTALTSNPTPHTIATPQPTATPDLYSTTPSPTEEVITTQERQSTDFVHSELQETEHETLYTDDDHTIRNVLIVLTVFCVIIIFVILGFILYKLRKKQFMNGISVFVDIFKSDNSDDKLDDNDATTKESIDTTADDDKSNYVSNVNIMFGHKANKANTENKGGTYTADNGNKMDCIQITNVNYIIPPVTSTIGELGGFTPAAPGEMHGYTPNSPATPDVQNAINFQLNGVKTWLTQMGIPEYYNLFILNGYDSMFIIQEIENIKEVEEIGVKSMVHQQRIWKQIKKIQQKSNTARDDGIEEDDGSEELYKENRTKGNDIQNVNDNIIKGYYQ